ncbi:MAG TPA: ABC transporter substrate-binding protein [Candidatus Limnocylindria bacterium]|nr:ABC transporter substrate-binding protein [Candidatus Limnocylindria bacterium]
MTNHRLLCLLILMVAMLATMPSTASAQLTKLRASYAGTTGYHLPMWVQKQEGLDKKYGLDMEMLLIAGGSRIIQTLLSGELLLTHSGASTVARAGIAGADLKMIATVMNQVNWRIVARKEIRDVKDLVGKRIAIASRGGSSELGLQLAFKKWNLDFNRVTLLSLGPSPTRMAALREGVVDATVFAYPELLVATKEGFPTIADLRHYADLTDTSVVVTGAGLEKQRPVLKRFLQGYVEAIARVKNNPDAAYRALSRYTGVSERGALEETRKFYADSFTSVPRTEMSGWRNLIATLGKSEGEMARFIDMSLLDELEREKFFDRIAK